MVCVSEMFSSSTLVYSLSLFFSLSLLFFFSSDILFSSSRHNLISTADELDDLSLFHRAAVSSINNNNRRLISLSSNPPPPKIAFLFLTNSDLTFLPLWESFFQGHEGLYNAYIHADPTSTISPLLLDSSINAKFVPAKRTARASPTLISAERRLLASAILDDPNNLYFALISQHCIPLHSFSYIHNHLFSDQSSQHHHQSFIEIVSDDPFLPKRYNARGDKAMLPEIRYEDFRVGSQFFVLAKRHALMVIKERKLWRKFKLPCLDTESCYPEEHYFPTLLSLKDPKGCSHFTLTRVNWTGSVGGHPHTYGASEISPQLIHSLRRSNSSLDYFFARKFSSESLQPLMEIADAVIFRD